MHICGEASLQIVTHVDECSSQRYIVSVKAAGVREVKNHLSRYLRLVSEGEVVLITDRGEVVAQLAPPPTSPSPSDNEELALERLARLGRLRLGRGRVVSADSHVVDPELEGVVLAQVLADIRSDR